MNGSGQKRAGKSRKANTPDNKLMVSILLAATPLLGTSD